MRLTSLSLRNYGNFASEDITFDVRPGTINLLVAPNGSGKSVLRSAFCDLLFGISGQTPMGFRFGYAGMRVSADAITKEGERFTFGRRKGQGNTLVDGEGNTLDPVTLARVLGRTDRTLLERLFALDTKNLREGQDELLASNGALAAALVSGAGGTRNATRLRESLEAARDALAPMRRSSQRPFYVELEKFIASRRQLSNSVLKPEQREKQEKELGETREHLEEQNKRADIGSAEIARLERLRRVAPWLAVYDEAAAWIAAHPDAPVLDADLATRLAEIRAASVVAEDRAARDRAQVGQLTKQLQSIVLDAPLLAAAAEIDRLVAAAGAARKAAADLPVVQSELDTCRRRIAALLQELGSSEPVTNAAKAIPPRTAINRARRLIAAHRDQVSAMNSAQRRVAEFARNLAHVDAQLAALPSVGDTQALDILVQEIRSEGDPARRRRELAAALASADVALSDALARVPGWTSGAQALSDLAPLQPTAYDQPAKERDAARAEELNRRKLVDEAKDTLGREIERLAAISEAGAIVTEQDLVGSRTHRDAGWHLIYRRAFTDDPPSAEEHGQFAGELPLPLAYERAVSAADAMADTRMQRGSVIVQAEVYRSAVAKAQAAVSAAEERHRIQREVRQAVERKWSQMCSGLPLGAAPAIGEVHAFLAARERVIDVMRVRATTENILRALDGQHALWVAELAAHLSLQPDQPLTLTQSLSAADQVLKHANDARAERTRVADRRESAAEALAKERDKISTDTAELADWREKWCGLMAELGRPTNEEPEVTDELLQLMIDLAGEDHAAAALAARIEGMGADGHRFRSAASALVSSVAPDLHALTPFDAVAELNRRLVHQRGLEKQDSLLRSQFESAQASTIKAEMELAEHRAALRATLLLIGADSVEVAEARLALSNERRQQDASLADAQAKLHEAGHALSLEELRAEVAVVSIDDIETIIDRASRDRKHANDAAQAAAAQIARLDQQMERDKVATSTSTAVMEQQAAAATIGRVLEEALVSHIASALLEKSLAAVDAAGDPELLRRLSELFRTLTDGIYDRVYPVTEDDKGPRLVLRERAFPGDPKEMWQLSEGTRDQLFLALRMAAIEEHAATAPPLPFIGDDILQTFDDDRALATMRVLLELSRSVQVILLTHHRHLLELAAHLPAETVHVCKLKQYLPA